MAIARGSVPWWRHASALLLVAVLAITAGVPAPLRALDAEAPGDLHLERSTSQRLAVLAPESQQVKLPALAHAALPGKCLLPLPRLRALAAAPEYASVLRLCVRGSAGCRAPPVVIPS